MERVGLKKRLECVKKLAQVKIDENSELKNTIKQQNDRILQLEDDVDSLLMLAGEGIARCEKCFAIKLEGNDCHRCGG